MVRNYTARQAAHVMKKNETGVPEEMKNSTAFTAVTDQFTNEIRTRHCRPPKEMAA
jgi:hypothetical protein